MKRVFIFFYFFAVGLMKPCIGQISIAQLLNDSNITWATSATITVPIGMLYNDSFGLHIHAVNALSDTATGIDKYLRACTLLEEKIIKFIEPLRDLEGENARSQFAINRFLIDSLALNNTEVYLDANLTQRISHKAAIHKFSYYVDTLCLYGDRETNTVYSTESVRGDWNKLYSQYSNQARITLGKTDRKIYLFMGLDTITKPSPMKLDDISYTSIQFLWYYNKNTESFYFVPYAIAPNRYIYSVFDRTIGLQPLFWVKIPIDFSNTMTPDNPAFSWGLRTTFSVNLETWEDLFSYKLLKEITPLKDIIPYWRHSLIKNFDKNPIYESFDLRVVGQKNELEQMLIEHTDTITIFDPENVENVTYALPIIVDELKITKMEFMLEWYYDSNRKRIIAHPKRYTPVYTAYNQDGFSLHNRTLFWLGYREHFKSTR